MTQAEVRDTILQKIQEKLQKTVGVKAKLDEAFTNWFQALLVPPMSPAPIEGAPEGEM